MTPIVGTFVRAVFFLCLSLMAGAASAAKIDDLLVGEVDVDSRDNQQLNAGVKAALAQVLVRVTGDDTAPQQPQGKAIVRQARQVMLSYAYESGQQLRLRVTFDQDQLKKRLQQSGLPIWGVQRPTTIHWLAVESDGYPVQLQTDLDRAGEASSAMAERRGLPQLLPILDLEDNMNVDVSDVVGNFSEPVLTASSRYGSDFVLMSFVVQEGEQWHYRTNLYTGGDQQSDNQRTLLNHQGVAPSRDEALEAILAEVGYYYSQRYAAVASDEEGQSRLVFTIDGGINKLVELERYLQTLAPVQSSKVVAVDGQQITIELDLIGGLAELEQLMTLESRLTRIESVDFVDEQIRYQWQ